MQRDPDITKQIRSVGWQSKHPPFEIDERPPSEGSKYSDMKTQEEQNYIEILRHEEYNDLTEIYKPASEESNLDLQ